jgi:magnesium transporter
MVVLARKRTHGSNSSRLCARFSTSKIFAAMATPAHDGAMSRRASSTLTGLDNSTRNRLAVAAGTGPGASPGTLYPSADAAPTEIHVIVYGPHDVQERHRCTLSDIPQPLPEGCVLWIDVRGVGNIELLQALAARYGIHALVLADIVNIGQRPKVEDYDQHTFVIAHMITALPHNQITVEQVSLLIGERYVITVQEGAEDGDVFEGVRRRLRQTKGRIRTSGADYLAYALLDAVVDAYFPVLEQVSQRLEELEQPVLERPTRDTGRKIYAFKRNLLLVRRSIWPQREALNSLLRDDESFMTAATRVYLRDVVDHATQVTDLVETYREFSASLMDLYLSAVNNRMNEVVKVLTIISTIFLPLSFIAGIYGMNFATAQSPWNMPELNWFYGYPFALGLMAAVAIAMLYGFRRAGWMGGRRAIASGRPLS